MNRADISNKSFKNGGSLKITYGVVFILPTHVLLEDWRILTQLKFPKGLSFAPAD
jgi:hypothetical protein